MSNLAGGRGVVAYVTCEPLDAHVDVLCMGLEHVLADKSLFAYRTLELVIFEVLLPDVVNQALPVH